MAGYSKKMEKTVTGADTHLSGVRLGQACVQAQIPAQIVAGWLGVSRQGVYNWFTGVSDVAPGRLNKVERITLVLTQAVNDGKLPAVDLKTSLEMVKAYKRLML